MDGIIFDIKKFAIHDGQGIRTTVFFKGCPLNCQWCHNPESRNSGPEQFLNQRSCAKSNKQVQVGYKISSQKVLQEIEKDSVFYDESGGGVTFSGGEPLLQIDFLAELLKICREKSIHTTVDTSGYVEFSSFEKIVNNVDTFLFDLKIMDDAEHIKYTTVSNTQIISNLQKLVKIHNDIRVRIPLISNITDTRENLVAIIDFLKAHPKLEVVDLIPYNKFGEDKIDRFALARKKMSLEPQSDSKLNEIKQLFESNYIAVQIGG